MKTGGVGLFVTTGRISANFSLCLSKSFSLHLRVKILEAPVTLLSTIPFSRIRDVVAVAIIELFYVPFVAPVVKTPLAGYILILIKYKLNPYIIIKSILIITNVF